MRIGLVADIHNDHLALARALVAFQSRGVRRVLTLGDTCDPFAKGTGAAEVAELLAACGAEGVWGNHDFTLCRDVPAVARAKYPARLFEVMGRMEPRLVIGEAHFSHREASCDPFDMEQLWDMTDRPLELGERAALAFAAVASRWQFVGHFHRWWATTPEGPMDWTGERPLRFEAGRRYFVVVAAVFEGWCAVLDLERGELEPVWCGEGR